MAQNGGIFLFQNGGMDDRREKAWRLPRGSWSGGRGAWERAIKEGLNRDILACTQTWFMKKNGNILIEGKGRRKIKMWKETKREGIEKGRDLLT